MGGRTQVNSKAGEIPPNYKTEGYKDKK